MNNNITLKDLLNKLKNYNIDEIEIIKKAYEYAENLHRGQMRQSGEAYVSHPLNVAYILAEMHADSDTICAGLLHDTIEDTNISKEDIAHDFNQDIANLVDGVTKLAKMNFSSKQDQNYANTRKIITSITEDELKEAELNFQAVYQKKNVDDINLPIVTFDDELLDENSQYSLVDCVFSTGKYKSKNEVRRLIQQGAVKLNGKKITDLMFVPEEGNIIQVGKGNMFKLSSKQKKCKKLKKQFDKTITYDII